MTLGFEEARKVVAEQVGQALPALDSEEVGLLEAAGRVLARDVFADRDYPATARSARDGFAVRAADLPGRLRIIGEVRAGETYGGQVGAGETVEIMTGAPIPAGADAVVMVEKTTRDSDFVVIEISATAGDAISSQGADARQGSIVIPRGRRLGFAGIGMLATVGMPLVPVYRRPRVAILATGDEVVAIEENPLSHQVRNSNSYSLAAQVTRAGGVPEILPVASDLYASSRTLIERGLEADLLLLSGGVSAGRYDIVEPVLKDLGASFFFDRVRIQPGQPLVFGRARDRFFFGLPGNPASTMMTFELFGRIAVELLSGCTETRLPLLHAKLTIAFRQKSGLTRFLPALLSPDGATVTPVSWTGSGDVPALVRANAFLVTEENRESWQADDWIRVLLQ